LGLDLQQSGRVLRRGAYQPRELSRKNQIGTFVGDGITDKKALKQEQDNLLREARVALEDLFPKLPEADIKKILKHAFTLVSPFGLCD